MNIEIAAFLFSGLCAAIVGYLTYSQESSPKRRLYILATLLLAALTGLLGLEVAVRKSKTETLPQELEREWLRLQDTQIMAVEVEALAPDGILSPGLLELARGVRFKISDVGLNSSSDGSAHGEIDFATALSARNLRDGARLGYVLATIKYSDHDSRRTIESIEKVNCISSQSNSARLRDGSVTEKDLGGVCSVAVRFQPSDGDVLLSSVAASPNVVMTLTIPETTTCLGNCEPWAMFSVKAVLRHGMPFWPTMIELSPALLSSGTSSRSEAMRTVTFEMSGKTLMELAKSYYLQTSGYRDRDRFAFTKGLLTAIWRRVSTRTEEGNFIDIVWTTDPDTNREHLLEAIPIELRSRARISRIPEWCGFGDLMNKEESSRLTDGQLCWHRFFILDTGK